MEKTTNHKFLAIPAVNCVDEACVQRKLRMAREFGAEWVHVDITDGEFSTNPTWGEAQNYHDAGMKLEVHLMASHPEQLVDAWLTAGVQRIIVHVEALMGRSEDVFFDIRRKCADYGVELMLSENPDTAVEELYPYLETVNAFQLLAVVPGLSGQTFDDRIVGKVTALRGKTRQADIEVDGGVNPLIASRVRAAGANIVTAASYIFGSEEPRAAFEELGRA